MKRQGERRDVFERHIGEISKAVNAINGTDAKRLYDALLTAGAQARPSRTCSWMRMARRSRRRTRRIRDGVIIVEGATPSPAKRAGLGDGPPVGKVSKAGAAALKVASLSKRDEDEPSLVDVAEPKRLDQEGEGP